MAGSITETREGVGNIGVLLFACIADAVTGAFPDHLLAEKFVGGASLVTLVVEMGQQRSPSSSASVSASASVSPSMSASTSASASVSPSSTASISASGSLSPSVSASASSSPSRSPSASLSPSRSASASASPSLSPSASISPSSSRSPSASASPSIAAPTDNVDIVLLNRHRVDVLQGLGQDLDQAATVSVPILHAGTNVHPVVHEKSALVLRIGDNLAPSAELTVAIYFARGH